MNSDSTGATRPLADFRNASKWYGPVIAVNDVSFELRPGITGLVGPNGAGKSTLIKLLTGQLRPSLGSVHVRGLAAASASARSLIGYCADADAFYEEMSGRRFVRMMARFHGFTRAMARERTDAVLHQVGMSHRADRRLASYSKGMRQRIRLAQALVHDPQLLVLDEPLNGVDPVGRRELVTLFRSLTAEGKCVLVSSHILEDMDRLADRILFMCRGRMLASGSLEEIRDMLDNHPMQVRVGAANDRELAAELLRCEFVHAVSLERPGELAVQINHGKRFFAAFAELVSEREFGVERLQVTDASTEAVFDYLIRDTMHP